MSQTDIAPIGYWNFTARQGPFQGLSPNWALKTNGATITDRGLKVAVNQYAVATGYTGKAPVSEKTLVAWLRLADLDARGGAALTIDSKSVDQFDGLVYGEVTPLQWIMGSNGAKRTPRSDADYATEDAPGQLVQIVGVYRNTSTGSTIEGYRNGTLFTTFNYTTPLPIWQPGDIQLFFGKRHHLANPVNCYLDAVIVAAAIYDIALPKGTVPGLDNRGLQ